jgi:hypothetical protein
VGFGCGYRATVAVDVGAVVCRLFVATILISDPQRCPARMKPNLHWIES